MPSKFPRRSCALCGVKHVAYKMPSLANEAGNKRIFICWECAHRYYEKLVRIKIWEAPDKEFLLSQAFKLPPKPKIDPYNKP